MSLRRLQAYLGPYAPEYLWFVGHEVTPLGMTILRAR